ncbi:MAG: hypothetical protein GY847_11245 [Proteobacteria bacterium]|nr:hypothetical protein [Pseudomonadota bacterium]
MKTKPIFVLFSCVIVAIIAYFVARSDENHNQEQIASEKHQGSQANDVSKKHLMEKSKKIEALRAKVALKSLQNASANSNKPEKAPPSIRIVNESVAKLNGLLGKESKDAKWQNDVEEYAKSILEESDVQGSIITNVDCVSSFCRLNVEHENENALKDFSLKMQTKPLIQEKGDSFGTAEPDNEKVITTIYFSRPDENLPVDPAVIYNEFDEE